MRAGEEWKPIGLFIARSGAREAVAQSRLRSRPPQTRQKCSTLNVSNVRGNKLREPAFRTYYSAVSTASIIFSSPDFDEITYHCHACRTRGIIRSVAVNATAVILSGLCPHCGAASSRKFDLVEVDKWLRDTEAATQ